MKTKKFTIISVLIALVMLTACNPKQETKTLTFSGVVTDNNNYPLEGVKVSIEDYQFVTGETGSFLFDELEFVNENAMIYLEKDNYFSNSLYISNPEEINQIQVALVPLGKTDDDFGAGAQISVSNGGEVTVGDGSSVFLPPGSVSSADANINANFSHIPSNDYSFGLLAPGENLKGINQDGEEIMLYAYSLMFIELSDAKGKINLKTEASIKIAIDEQDIGFMPDEMEMYSYNTETGLWQFESFAANQGDHYLAHTSHFSSWITGISVNQTAIVKGRVIDRSGRPIKGQIVRVFQTKAITDNDGYYKTEVPANHTFVVGMNYKGFEIRLDAGPLANNEVHVLDLSVPPMTMISGVITGCDGQNISGQANLTWGEPEFSNQYTKDGNFELSIPSAVKKSTLTISVGDSIVKQEILNPDKKTEINVGNISLCVKSKENRDETKEDKPKEDDKEKKEEVKKPKKVNVVGTYDFESRSDGQRLVSYHRISVKADGNYQEDYSPVGSNYEGGTKGTWKHDGDKLILTSVGGLSETYKIDGNMIIRTCDDGIVFKFRKK
jgi:hypothetical protein